MDADEVRITEETVVNTTSMAVLTGLTARRVQQLIQDGTFTTESKGLMRAGDTLRKYHNMLKNSKEDEEDRKVEKARRAAEVKLKTSKAAVAALEAEELRGKMHRSEDVSAMTEDLIYTIRGALIALPGRLAVDVTACSTPSEASEVIRKEVHKVMRELANYRYDPKKYEERVRERKDWGDHDDDDS